MSKYVLDAKTLAELRAFAGPVDVYGEDGQPAGVFLTQEAYLKMVYALAWDQVSQKDAQEAREDYRQRGGVTTAQILEHLRQLKANGPA